MEAHELKTALCSFCGDSFPAKRAIVVGFKAFCCDGCKRAHFAQGSTGCQNYFRGVGHLLRRLRRT